MFYLLLNLNSLITAITYAILSSFIYSYPIYCSNPCLIDSYFFFSDLRASLLQCTPFRAITKTHPKSSTGAWCGSSAFEWNEHILLGAKEVLLLCHIYQLMEDAVQTPLSGRNGSVVWNAAVCRESFVLHVSNFYDIQCCLFSWLSKSLELSKDLPMHCLRTVLPFWRWSFLMKNM